MWRTAPRTVMETMGTRHSSAGMGAGHNAGGYELPKHSVALFGIAAFVTFRRHSRGSLTCRLWNQNPSYFRGLSNFARCGVQIRAAASAVIEPEVGETSPPDGVPEEQEDLELMRKFQLVRSVGEECQTEAELKRLIEKKPNFILYDGFEPSGRMHIAQGVFKSLVVNKCTEAGGTFIFWVADWFALMNDKMGGDIDKIRTVGEYLIEVWKATGMDMSRVKFLWSSEEISNHAEEYWGQALDIARRSTLARVKKCCQIMGRNEESLTAAQILYPIMQCTDIFFLKADICQLGVDQRKVNMLARDYCDAAGRKLKPVILSHHMLYGLKQGQAKMSKSDPDSAIFMEDAAEDVARKISQAYCPTAPEDEQSKTGEEGMHLVEDDLKNPCLDYMEHILFSKDGFEFEAGGSVYKSFADLKQAFVAGEVSEETLKASLIQEINVLLEPVRKHFTEDPRASELLGKVRQWRRDTLTPTSSLVRLKLADFESKQIFAVFAPLPDEAVYLRDVLGVIKRLQEAPQGSQRVLWLEDWTARALGRVGGTVDCVHSYYKILLHGLHTFAPEIMDSTRVCWQGEAILTSPNDYWTSVINAGRQCSLEVIRSMAPEGTSLEYASEVVGALMHIGDVLALCGGNPDSVLCCDTFHESLHKLATRHFDICGLPAPTVSTTPEQQLRLQPLGEGLEVDAGIFLTDRDPDVNKKMKKAFCEPENVEFCPPIAWVEEILNYQAEFVIKRKPDNGGDKHYDSVNLIREDFESGALHPGDLKPAVSKALNALLNDVRAGMKKNELKQAQKKLEAYTKKMRKQKKK